MTGLATISERPAVPRRWRGRVAPTITALLSLCAFVGIWQWYGTRPDEFAVSPPTKVFPAMWRELAHGDLLSAIGGTLAEMALGYVVAVVIGVSLGIMIGLSNGWLKNTIEPLAFAAYSAPVALAIPILGIYTGLGFRGVVSLVVLWCVFEIMANTIAGVRETPTPFIDVARSFQASKPTLYFRVILPAAFPYIVVGLRMGVGRAMRGAVTAQLLLAVVNLGLILRTAGSLYDMSTLLATIVVIVIFGVVMMKVAEVVEDRVLRARHAKS